MSIAAQKRDKSKIRGNFTNKIQGRSPQKFRKIHFPIDLRDKSFDCYTNIYLRVDYTYIIWPSQA